MNDLTEDQLNEIYEELYYKYFKKYEKMRKALKYKIVATMILLCLSFFMSIPIEEEEKVFPYLIIAIISALLGIGIFLKPGLNRENYEILYKREVISEYLRQIMPNAKYFPQIDQKTQNKSITMYKQAEFDTTEIKDAKIDDYILYKTNNSLVSISDFGAQHTRNKGQENKEIVYMQQDIFAYIQTNIEKSFKIKIIYKDKYNEQIKNTILLDNEQFNKKFQVICNSNIASYQLLTTDVIEELNSYVDKFEEKFDISIDNSNIYFRFLSGGMLDAPFNEHVIQKENFIKYYRILRLITTIINRIEEIYSNSDL